MFIQKDELFPEQVLQGFAPFIVSFSGNLKLGKDGIDRGLSIA